MDLGEFFSDTQVAKDSTGFQVHYGVQGKKYQDTKYPTGLVAQRIRLCQWLHFRFHRSFLVPTQYSEVMQNKLELAALVLLLKM